MCFMLINNKSSKGPLGFFDQYFFPNLFFTLSNLVIDGLSNMFIKWTCAHFRKWILVFFIKKFIEVWGRQIILIFKILKRSNTFLILHKIIKNLFTHLPHLLIPSCCTWFGSYSIHNPACLSSECQWRVLKQSWCVRYCWIFNPTRDLFCILLHTRFRVYKIRNIYMTQNVLSLHFS